MNRMMKRLLCACTAAVCVLALGTAALALSGNDIRVCRYLRTQDGSHIFIDGRGSPTIMTSPRQTLFDGLETGDRVLVVCGAGTADVYPGRNVARWCLRLGGGGAEDLPLDTLSQLSELGWLSLPLYM